MKKFFSITIILFLIATLILSVSADESSLNNINSMVVSTDKVYCSATLEDSFAEDSIIVVINKDYTRRNITFSPSHFSSIQAKSVRNLTTPISDLYTVSATEEATIEKNNTLSLTNVEEFRQIIEIKLRNPGKQNVLNAIKELEKIDYIESAEPNYYFYPEDIALYSQEKEISQELLSNDIESTSVTPNDEKFAEQYALNKIQVTKAWDITTGTKSVRVGIIDSGISNHPDLSGNLVTGWDFFNENGITTDDPSGHGTGVAGIIGAKGNNDIGICGINWNISLVPLQVVIDDKSNDDYGLYSQSAIAEAIDYARTHNIAIINCSFGGYRTYWAYERQLCAYNGIVVSSAGNGDKNGNPVNTNTTHFDPACYTLQNIISVAASNRNDNLANKSPYWSSNYGSTCVDLAAPGIEIRTTNIGNDYWNNFEATSAAAPHVTGVAALIKSIRPDLNAVQIKSCILNGVDKITALDNYCVTGGRLNAYKALSYAQTYPVNQMAVGDFNGDGKDDVVALDSLMGYAGGYNEIQLKVTLGGSNSTTIWRTESQYNGTKIVGRMTAGDFNGDGKDDIATMYDYGSYKPNIHVFLSTGSSFKKWTTWHTETETYNPERVSGRFVAGDFNGDGKDDIATMYDYADHSTKILMFISNGSSFNTRTPWYTENTAYYYNAPAVTDRFKSGDFNNDGKDDIVTFYQYSTGVSKIHVFTANTAGTSFNNWVTWYDGSNPVYNLDKVEDRFAVGDFNNDNKLDVATMYNLGSGTMRIETFLSKGTSFNSPATWYSVLTTNYYHAQNTTGFFGGDFNGNGISDLVSRYNYSSGLSSLLLFNSTGSRFSAFTTWASDL